MVVWSNNVLETRKTNLLFPGRSLVIKFSLILDAEQLFSAADRSFGGRGKNIVTGVEERIL